MMRVLTLSSVFLYGSMAMAQSPIGAQGAIKALNAFAAEAYCSEVAAADVLAVGQGVFIGQYSDWCGHGGHASPRAVLTVVKWQPGGTGQGQYRVVETNVLEKLDIWGHIESLKHEGKAVVLTMSQLGPEDARCCPSIRMQYRIEIGSWRLLTQRPLRTTR